MGFRTQLMHAWNAFTNQSENTQPFSPDYGRGYSTQPDRVRFRGGNERSIVSSIYTRVAIDVSSIDIRHVRVDGAGRYKEDMNSGLQNILQVEANIDQTPVHLKRDIVLSLFGSSEGSIAVLPIDTNVSPMDGGSLDIETVRVATITDWYPRHVRVEAYNDRTGRREPLMPRKQDVAIIENPLVSIVNEPNSTLQRLIRKLNILDAIDEQSGSGKLDMIIQLPYTIKTETRRQQAEQRRQDIEFQLKGSKYGIAYTDGTEKITQLNRPAENNLLSQIEYLTKMLYGQLGLTEEIMNGTADEPTMLNYINRTIEPILEAIVQEFRRKFLTKTARSQGQTIMYFRDPFKLVPMSDFAEMADKLTRNEILTSNELRQFAGIRPSDDPKADELRNSNMPRQYTDPIPTGDPNNPELPPPPDPNAPADDFDPYAGINETLDGVFKDLGVEG